MTNSQEISVTYMWTAKPGKMDELKAIYEDVARETKANEPGVQSMSVSEVQGSDAIIIQEVFEDGAALGMHFANTASQFFPELLKIADPGSFYFLGNVPDELVQAAAGMGLNATFATPIFGFTRS
jgi:quinol monooxygenase YgiN